MRKIVVFNNRVARVTLEGDVEQTRDGEYAARGIVKVVVSAKQMSKERFLHAFYESLFAANESYEAALEEFGPGFVDDDMLPDLGKAAIRLHSKTLCEWRDPTFTIDQYDDFYNDAGTTCEKDSADAARMCLATGAGSLEYTLNMAQVAEMVEAPLLAGRLQWRPSIDICIGVFLDFQKAQGEGTWFKTLNEGFTLCPASLPLQAIMLDAATRRYRLIAGPATGSARFVRAPSAIVRIEPDPVPAPAGCTSTLVTWPKTASPVDLLAIGTQGDMALGYEALGYAQRSYYRIEITGAPTPDKPFEITDESIDDFDVVALKLNEDGTMVPAKEATLAIVPPGEGDLWNATVIGEAYDRHVVLSVDQTRGPRAARNDSNEVLKAPDDYILRRVDALHVTLTVDNLVLTKTLLVGITLPRWFPLEGSKEETHLRTNYATVLQGLRDAIARYNREHGPPARFNVVAENGFDKLSAGDFLFRHNASDAIANRYYFTMPEQVESNGKCVNEWLTMLYGCPQPESRPPPMTEAALVARIIELHKAKGDKLTPGDVFSLGLEETGGDIGGALLICHNTMRSLARDCGDSLRTGVNALDKEKFDKIFLTIRGGYRCSDGAAGAKKDENCAQANFANDYAGPWYHFFGTAYYEIYTTTPDDKTPADNRWARTANVLEQWYREYCPTSWQDPDPEKEYVNRWGIAAADQLLGERPWSRE